MTTKIYLIRHGETSANKSGVMHLDNDQAKLTDKGKKQIRKTSEKLKECKITKIFCSTEYRAIQSAKLISNYLGLKPQIIEGLEERRWGIYAGKPWDDIKLILDKMTVEERYTFIPEGGESWKQFIERLGSTIEKIVKTNTGENIAVITHGGVIRALIPYLLNKPKEESFKYDPPNTSISIFEYADGKFEKIILNDTSHLK